MKIWVLNKTKSFLFDFSAYIYLVYSIYLQWWVKKYTSVLYFLKNKGVWLRTLARETKVSNYKTCIELQNLAWKVKLSHKMNESRHNQYIKPKVLSYHLKLKTAISHFVFPNISCKHWSCYDSSALWIYFLVKNKSVKLPFVTKNSKHLVGTSGNDSSALIEFTPLWKTRVSNYPL